MWNTAANPFMKRTRKRYCLRPETARTLLHAERFARALGTPLNVFVTIKFPLPSRSGKPAHKLFSQYVWGNARRRWTAMNKRRNRPVPFRAIAVFENPLKRIAGKRRHYGPYHVHWMLHWDLSDVPKLKYNIRKHMRNRFHKFQNHHLRIVEVWDSARCAKYMAKGIDAPFADHFYLKHSPQGPINHRRIMTTRSLGPKARKNAPASWKTRRPSYRGTRGQAGKSAAGRSGGIR
jgi:hypothetical protein